MRKKLGILSLLLIFSMGLCACRTPSPPTEESEPQSETESQAQQESTSESESETKGDTDMEQLVIISDGACQYKLIVPKSINPVETEVLQKFYEDFKEKTGVALRDVRYDETEPETERELLLGNVPGRKAAEDGYKTLSYSACSVGIVGEQVVVSAFADGLLERALTKLLSALTEDENGNWVLSADYSYEYDASGVKVPVPSYETAAGALEGVYSSGDDNFELSVKGTTQTEVTRYLGKMRDAGFTLYDSNTIEDNQFATYTAKKDGVETAAYTKYFKDDGIFQVVWGVRGYLPETQSIAYPTSPKTTPSITQLGREQVYNGWNATAKRVDGAPGMGYVIQLADGRYILIDSGPADKEITLLEKQGGEWGEGETRMTEDAKRLYDFLVANNPNGGKPVIAAWLITHAHSDHVGLANQFLQTYKNDIVVELAGYNFPDLYNVTITEGGGAAMASGAASFRTALNAFPAAQRAKQMVFHTGQRLYFPGCEIEILYTQEDYFPGVFATGNRSSAVFRVTMEAASGDKTVFMVMGDADGDLCPMLARRYGAELKCDILQLTHHGFNGGSSDAYQLMAPEICFWSCDPYRYETDTRCLGTKSGFEFNKWVRENVSTHYTSEVTTTILIQ